MNKEKILIVDDNLEILEIIQVAIESVFTGEILMAHSVAEAKIILEKNVKPILVISDFTMPDGSGADLYNYVMQKYPDMEFYICSGNHPDSILKKIPTIKKIISKPNIFVPLQEAVTQFLKNLNPEVKEKEYVPLRISILMRLGFIHYDLFMKLSETKYVKISHKDSEFDPETARKYLQKKVVFLYLRFEDTRSFIQEFVKSLDICAEKASTTTESLFDISQESFEATISIVNLLGWSSDTKEIVKKSVKLAVNTLAKDSKLKNLLEKLFASKDEYLATHTHMVATIACGMAKTLQWDSDYTNIKICMAAIMHDLSLRNLSYENIVRLDQLAIDSGKGELAEVENYKKHPENSVALLSELEDLPPDVDKIIAQHHERPDGKGFPHQVDSLRISPLAAIFIIAQDLVDYCFQKKVTKQLLDDFIKARSEYYSRGYYKKVFKALTTSLS